MAKTLLLRNTMCSFSCPWINKLDGSDNHTFEKDEIFEVPAEIERERNGKKVMISTLELLQNAFGKGIEEAKGAVSMTGLKEKDEEIARLKAELEEAKKTKKTRKKSVPAEKTAVDTESVNNPVNDPVNKSDDIEDDSLVTTEE